MGLAVSPAVSLLRRGSFLELHQGWCCKCFYICVCLFVSMICVNNLCIYPHTMWIWISSACVVFLSYSFLYFLSFFAISMEMGEAAAGLLDWESVGCVCVWECQLKVQIYAVLITIWQSSQQRSYKEILQASIKQNELRSMEKRIRPPFFKSHRSKFGSSLGKAWIRIFGSG